LSALGERHRLGGLGGLSQLFGGIRTQLDVASIAPHRDTRQIARNPGAVWRRGGHQEADQERNQILGRLPSRALVIDVPPQRALGGLLLTRPTYQSAKEGGNIGSRTVGVMEFRPRYAAQVG